MSTSSDGHKAGRMEDPLILRKKYDNAKARLRDKADELGDAQVGYDKIKKKNENLERIMAKMKADLIHTEELLERTRRQAAVPLNAMEENQRRRNRDEYHRFAGIMRFLEDSLQFIPPAHDGEPIESRLATVIMRISEKEKEYEKMKQKLEEREDEDMVARAARLGQEGQEGYTPQPLEATLTRVMKASEEKIAKLTEELEAVKEQESTWRNNSVYFEQKLSQLTADHDKALADLEEAQAKEDNLTKLLTRSEKGKTAMQQSIDVKEKELSSLKRRYDVLQNEYKEKERSLAKQKQQYDTVKTRSLVHDLERIKELDGRLRDADREVIRAQKLVKEKDDLLAATKSKMWRLEEERNEGLQQLGHLQEELADKDLQLSNARAASGSIESFKKIAERERVSATQRANQEMEMLKQSLALVKKLADDREKETAFLKDAVHGSEEKISHLESRLETVSSQVKKRDDDAAIFKSTISSLERELANYRQTSDTFAVQAEGYAQKERKQQDLLSHLQKKVDAFDSVGQMQARGQKALLALRRRIDELNTSLSAPDSRTVSHNVGTDKEIKEELVKTSLELLYALEKVNGLQQFTRDEGRSQYETEIAGLKRTTQEVQKQRDSLRKEIEELRSSMVDLSCVKTEPGVTVEPVSDEMVLDLHRALATVEALEELVSTLEDEVVQMKQSREEMTKVDERLRQTIQEIEFDKMQLTERVTKLERDLGRREDDLKSKMEELASSQAKVHEQTVRGDGLEQRLQGVQRQMDLLEQDYAEQKQQLEGRESALRRLEQARNTYDKVHESKIASLKEEIKTVEKLSRTQWEKLTAAHAKEMQQTIDQCKTSIKEVQRKSEADLLLNSEYQAIVRERDALKAEVAELKESLDKTMKEIDDRHLLITGYMSLVSQQEGEGMLTEGSETLKGLLQQNQEQMATIEQQNQHLDLLRTALDDQIQIIMESNQNTDTLASNQERYLRQISELQDELSTLKTAHKKDLLHSKALEKELSEKTEMLRVLQDAAASSSISNSTSSGPTVANLEDEPMPSAPTEAAASSS
ncbi:hypothetical protein EC968_001935 [Mortierella alpina]|nr:hypothetical protein EC968_001935 [Mortierella alpina]